MFTKIKEKLREEVLFVVVFVLGILCSIWVKPNPASIDWKVIFSLFNLMLICKAFEKYGLLDKIALSILKKYRSEYKIGFAMIIVTALLAMFITNDVALLTVVPLTIILAKKSGLNPYRIIALETVASNIGSSLTPFGNPQNLYLYAYYKIDTMEFLKTMLPFTVLGLVLLIIINLRSNKRDMVFELPDVFTTSLPKAIAYVVLFVLVLMSILRILDYKVITILVLLLTLALDRTLFVKVDYFLLGTFICFFLLIDSITNSGVIQSIASKILKSPIEVLAASSLLSQFTSNVPAAILLSGFTGYYKELLLGVSLGGLGTMIASLANLISYKIYKKDYQGNTYSRYFYTVNTIIFVILFAALVAIYNYYY